MRDMIDIVGSGKCNRRWDLEMSRACFLIAVVVGHAQVNAIGG